MQTRRHWRDGVESGNPLPDLRDSLGAPIAPSRRHRPCTVHAISTYLATTNTLSFQILRCCFQTNAYNIWKAGEQFLENQKSQMPIPTASKHNISAILQDSTSIH